MTKYLNTIKYWLFALAAVLLYAAGFQKGRDSQKISKLKGVANAAKIAKASRDMLDDERFVQRLHDRYKR
ncbi:MAG: hypothetical protein FWF01_03690 [Alphaproteobacteria bacterium]|nr:hypothetical protein [Alphaproteobacteria bacterium]